jgi:hypothetical protein
LSFSFSDALDVHVGARDAGHGGVHGGGHDDPDDGGAAVAVVGNVDSETNVASAEVHIRRGGVLVDVRVGGGDDPYCARNFSNDYKEVTMFLFIKKAMLPFLG